MRVAFVPELGGRTNQVVSILAAARGLTIEPFIDLGEAVECLIEDPLGTPMHALLPDHGRRMHR